MAEVSEIRRVLQVPRTILQLAALRARVPLHARARSTVPSRRTRTRLHRRRPFGPETLCAPDPCPRVYAARVATAPACTNAALAASHTLDPAAPHQVYDASSNARGRQAVGMLEGITKAVAKDPAKFDLLEDPSEQLDLGLGALWSHPRGWWGSQSAAAAAEEPWY